MLNADVKCECCGRLIEAIVMRYAAAMSKDEAMDYGEELGVVYDDFEGYCECDGEGEESLAELRERTRVKNPWASVGAFGDLIVGEAGSKNERYEARQRYEAWSDGQRAAFWNAYRELEQSPLGVDAHGRPDGQHLRHDGDVAAAEKTVAVLNGRDDQLTGDTVEFVKTQPVHRGVFADALDAEWSARRPVVKGNGGRAVAREDTPSQIEDREAGVIEEFVASELNRRVALDEMYERRAARYLEALVVLDRRAVTICSPAYVASAEWDVERGEREPARVVAENKRTWNDSPEQANALAARIVSKLKARGVPVRTWQPDNRTAAQRKYAAWKYHTDHSLLTVTVPTPERNSKTRTTEELVVMLNRIDTRQRADARNRRLRVALYSL